MLFTNEITKWHGYFSQRFILKLHLSLVELCNVSLIVWSNPTSEYTQKWSQSWKAHFPVSSFMDEIDFVPILLFSIQLQPHMVQGDADNTLGNYFD